MRNQEVKLTEVINRNLYKSSRKFVMVVPFSRSWVVEEWFDCLSKIEWGDNDFWEDVTLLICADGQGTLDEVCKYIPSLPERFRYRVFKTDTQPIADFGDLLARRRRICSIWSQMWRLCDGEIVLGSEDDSLFPPDAYVKLVEILQKVPDDPKDKPTGFVQASIIGRWSSYMVPHWKSEFNLTRNGEKLYTWKTGEYKGKIIEEIDGGGWYCFAALKEAGDTASWEVNPHEYVGPDVLMVNSLKKKYNALGVWNIWVKHAVEDGTYIDIENVGYLDQIIIREERRRRWALDMRAMPLPFKNVMDKEFDQQELVKVIVRRNYQGAEGMVLRGRELVVTRKRYKELEAKKLAELIGVVEEDQPDNDSSEELDLQLDSTPDEVGPEPPKKKEKEKDLGFKEMADMQTVLDAVNSKDKEKVQPKADKGENMPEEPQEHNPEGNPDPTQNWDSVEEALENSPNAPKDPRPPKDMPEGGPKPKTPAKDPKKVAAEGNKPAKPPKKKS